MNTTKRTRNTAIGIALAATLITGLGACAGTTTHAYSFADRRASDISHEVERAQNRVDALAPRAEYRDQAERRLESGSPTKTEPDYRDQAERRLGSGTPTEAESHYRDLAERRLGVAGH